MTSEWPGKMREASQLYLVLLISRGHYDGARTLQLPACVFQLWKLIGRLSNGDTRQNFASELLGFSVTSYYGSSTTFSSVSVGTFPVWFVCSFLVGNQGDICLRASRKNFEGFHQYFFPVSRLIVRLLMFLFSTRSSQKHFFKLMFATLAQIL